MSAKSRRNRVEPKPAILRTRSLKRTRSGSPQRRVGGEALLPAACIFHVIYRRGRFERALQAGRRRSLGLIEMPARTEHASRDIRHANRRATEETMDKALYDKGLAVRREVLGAQYVVKAIRKATRFNKPMQEFVTEYCWGG